ncbi:YdcF family protein [Pseudomarimonas arenosa]|uniref:YdcF family protein n=1 Tax=Pseudomarimonas arenosa TaxID=2774145 RepID=A0AAW3ZJR7_9GAMM|nr:YdcF family protein [Pseudomarimonas arenosa]MBD8525417.1 YdcF family protein [Pseudomarimonas arenosa]
MNSGLQDGRPSATAVDQAGSSRAAHRRSIAADLDALHGLLVASLCCLLTGGLVFLIYLWRVARTAHTASADLLSVQAQPRVLLFGKHSPSGRPDSDFRLRIERALVLARGYPQLQLLLLGGGPAPSEAEVARRALQAAGLPATVSLQLEDQSRDTLQNLRHARALLGTNETPIYLLSNRYHLARCALFAQALGMPHRLCAAEAVWPWRDTGKLLLEALYCMWIDIGRRWAKLIGHQRMLAKVS